MSWQDRPYNDGNAYGSGRPELRLQFRLPTMLVTWLVLINIAMHLVHMVAVNIFQIPFDRWFGLSLSGLLHLRVWQLFTYMFVHDLRDLFHIIFNMLMLYFVGMQIERGFGRRRFLQFYFACGLIGGVAYLILGWLIPSLRFVPVVGASGAIWGLLIAAMVFYPSMQLIFFVFPMPIRVFGAIMLGIFVFQILSGGGPNLGGEICHLGGAIAGVAVLYAWGMMPRVQVGSEEGPLSRWSSGRTKNAWARKQKKLAAEQAEVDRILDKVHREGVASLTRREKKTLATATRSQQQRDRQAGRIDRV
jgi:membrane associated rhomboid family serine protease